MPDNIANNDNGWNEWGKHVLNELQRLNAWSQEIRHDLVSLRTDMTMVKMQIDIPRQKLVDIEIRLRAVEKAVDSMKPWMQVLSIIAGLLATAIFGLLWAVFTGQVKIVF